ncbi:alcohol dehydrogenase catalytic domain-containing protein [Rhodococcus wratislaviensis]|uniref:Putative glutathione-dependent formaldehyde dehydrogenase n=1 Tax=Rhodococcus wratislaviensis NBRC 100605 TaxID=1219028 RepID=X0PZB1_RHOWR|nr:alcohol dehydrogenase catalytic domain-containing protein [Rhodococcus wratislaviensis]GAF43121.1 putative glutathione-dependent formaldehyde dehydrogenase [Rhodococcus wratislaviensis NBRC 100605]
MKAVVFADTGRVEVIQVPDPSLIAPTDALVRVHRAAICGTDLHTITHPNGMSRGAVLGHEFAGTILEIGTAVRTFSPGDRVSGADFTACGHCWWCRSGNQWECAERQFFGTGAAFGPALDGAQAEIVRVPHADVVLHSIADDIPYESALFFGDILATGYAAVQRCDVSPGDTVAVVGGGPVGQMASLAAQACSAGPVVLVEPVEDRRAIAHEHGALVAAPDDARRLIDAVTDGRGADAVIEAVGGPRGLDTAFGLVRRRGTVVSVGVHQQPTWPLPVAKSFADELTLRFAIGNAIRDRDRLSGLVAAGAIDPTIIIDRRVSLDDAPAAYDAMTQRRTLKAVIEVP